MTDDELKVIEATLIGLRSETPLGGNDSNTVLDIGETLAVEVRRRRPVGEAPVNRYDVVYSAGRNRRRATVDAYSASDAVAQVNLLNRGALIRRVEPNPGGSLGDAPDPETE
jgi:hypothetical protein